MILMLTTIIYILVFVIVSLIAFSIIQIKVAGIQVKDFWSFIQANQLLDELYMFTKKEKILTPQEQVIFLTEAERVFEAFDKVPSILWDEEYQKYREVLNKYKDIKIVRWASN